MGVWCVRGQKGKKNRAGRGGGRKKGEISQCKCVCDWRGVVVVESAALGVSVSQSYEATLVPHRRHFCPFEGRIMNTLLLLMPRAEQFYSSCVNCSLHKHISFFFKTENDKMLTDDGKKEKL